MVKGNFSVDPSLEAWGNVALAAWLCFVLQGQDAPVPDCGPSCTHQQEPDPEDLSHEERSQRVVLHDGIQFHFGCGKSNWADENDWTDWTCLFCLIDLPSTSRIFARNVVLAKSRFWYFMKRLNKAGCSCAGAGEAAVEQAGPYTLSSFLRRSIWVFPTVSQNKQTLIIYQYQDSQIVCLG